MRFRTLIAAAALVFAAQARATTIVLPSDDQLIAKSPVIVLGQVIDSAAVEEGLSISTVTHIAVERTLKGSAPAVVTVRELGGRVGDRFNVVFGSPEFAAGEHVLVFLWPNGNGNFQTVDLFVGKLTERFTKDGQRLWYREEELVGTHLLDGKLQPMGARNIQRLADSFESYISARVAGRNRDRDYEVENPTLAPETRIRPQFTMIDEPNIYRWFTFDTGGSVNWLSQGSQPGFSGGGATEVNTAIGYWNSVSGAKIKYAYLGVSTGSSPGLSTPNGKNDILFNDPNGEIAGSYNPSTGGVIGRGGFNNVSGPSSWTSGYAADPGHPLKTYNAWRITEGNLVIQDGVTPQNGFSSTLLTAVISHEFGHTLGFGHSGDPGALMYASLNSGQTGALRTDDLNAAKWLYPGSTSGGSPGTPTPPPPTGLPAAPSNLVATVVNGTQIRITWKVNATNATKQVVYLASSNGIFDMIGELEPNRTSALITGLTPGVTYKLRVTAKNSAGESQPSNTAQATIPTTVNTTLLSLAGGRYRLSLEARDPRTGNTGAGRAIPQSDLFGYFSIPDLTGNPNNPEVFVKILNGGPVNGRYWVFWGGLTDVEYKLFVTDLSTGATNTYTKEAFSACGGYDTDAFAASLETGFELVDEAPPVGGAQLIALDDVTADACASGGLCLSGSRFRITLSATDPRTGTTAEGTPLPQTDLFGYFSIPGLTGNPGNPEVFVKVIDGRAVNGKFWVFYNSLTDVKFTLTITDTETGAVKSYLREGFSSCGGFDTAAF